MKSYTSYTNYTTTVIRSQQNKLYYNGLLYKKLCKLYNKSMLKISKVDKNGIGYELGFEKGDCLIAFDGYKVEDVLDYTFYDYKENFSITVLTKDGETVEVKVEKEEDETLGLYFESDNLDLKTCYNKCIFCFVDQMPLNMRKSLYVKDDDYRQSFLSGNFITFTNVKDSDIDRIIRLKLSPLYVSVQCMDGDIRNKMLGNRNAHKIVNQLKKLTDNGIKIHTQIVLVRGVNDGKYLDYSLNELHKLRPNLQSVAVVPCGITKFRSGLYPIKDIDKGYSNCVIEQVRNFNLKVKENFALLGDEFYFKAGLDVENYEYYGDFSQEGNGVGGTAKFSKELSEVLKESQNKGNYLLITGESASKFIKNCLNLVLQKCKNVKGEVLKVKNNYFGDTVNCTGLLTATDIITAINNYEGDYDAIILPNICLKQDEDVFLDDITLKEFKNKVNKKIIITNGSAQSFYDALTCGKEIRILK